MLIKQLTRSLVAVAVAIALVITYAAAPAHAAQPTVTTEVFDITVPIDGCGYPLLLRVQGVRTTRDFGGQLIQNFRNFSLTYTNPETGVSLSTPQAGINKITVNPDGSTTVAVVGVDLRLVGKGEGLIAANIGRVVLLFPADPNSAPVVLSSAGPQSGGGGGVPQAVVCELLAP